MVRGLVALACAAVVGGSAISACSSEPTSPSSAASDAGLATDATAVDAADEADVRDASPDPRPLPTLPQVLNPGNPVLTSPRVVAITFAGDSRADDIEREIATIAADSYFASTTSEYGVGVLTVAPPIRLPFAAPTTLSDGGIGAFLEEQFTGAEPNLGAPDPSTIYFIFHPSADVLVSGPCRGSVAYHYEAKLFDGGVTVPYAVHGECPNVHDYARSVAVSHEIAETVTDPYFSTKPAFRDVDDDHLAWELKGGGEVGDLCQSIPGIAIADASVAVTRIWSNAAARRREDPCVPRDPSASFFMLLPVLTDRFQAAVGDHSAMTTGVRLVAGTPRTIDVVAIGGAPGEVWDVSAAINVGDPSASATLDRAQATLGDTLKLTLKSSWLGVHPFQINTRRGAQRYNVPGFLVVE